MMLIITQLYHFISRKQNSLLTGIILICILFPGKCAAQTSRSLLDNGWKQLVIDNDTLAMQLFENGYEVALKDKNTPLIAEALLDLGICSYSVSYTLGLEYAFRSMEYYKKLEEKQPLEAIRGRSRCLQLISTIYSRQGKYKDAISLSREAMKGFPSSGDTSHQLGLIYTSLGVAYNNLNQPDSSEFYHRLALQERELINDYIYLPITYLKVADIERRKGNKEESRILFDRAARIADSTGNRQALVSSLLGKGDWTLDFERDVHETEALYIKALDVSYGLSDKSFYLESLSHLVTLMFNKGDYQRAYQYEHTIRNLKDSLGTWESQRMVKSLEVQFNVAEKERQLKLAEKENEVNRLTNYILWSSLAFIVLIATAVIIFLRRINKRDKQLLSAKQELVHAIEEQKKLKEQQMQNDLEHKEGQLSAMMLQMLQKNELMQELQEKLSQYKELAADPSLNRIISKGQNQDKDWTDFNTNFESLNKNFYTRLKSAYPDISPNDLKICALIKLNLSIKEMAGILNISPDSVKTARYRLRKKLQLSTEDNLTDFIISL
ncbi:MAG: hypothetical protein ABI772_05555 [Bacteroidota bacterium]